MRTWAGWLALGVAAVRGCEATCEAFYLDSGRNFDVRLRAYSQLGIMTQDSSTTGCVPVKLLDGTVLPIDPRTCPPPYSAGDLGQNRNFYNPEFDAKLTDYTKGAADVPGLQLIAPDELKFRFAWWGFYDGLYDYLSPVWPAHVRNGANDRFAPAQFGITRFSQTSNINRSYTFTDQNKNPRKIYGTRNRINELYLDYTKGPVFLRVGRQAISWGESDSIALLDVQNPFDLTLGAPGFFQDVDEARIPLYTVRSTVKLVDNWKCLSSFFLDTYPVPGPIETTVPIDPITGGVSPFSPDVGDPQQQAVGQVIPGPTGKPPRTVHVSTVSLQPVNNWGNSRWGARLTGVIFRDYTVQGW